MFFLLAIAENDLTLIRASGSIILIGINGRHGKVQTVFTGFRWFRNFSKLQNRP
jgi:hypothetical protein